MTLEMTGARQPETQQIPGAEALFSPLKTPADVQSHAHLIYGCIINPR